MSDERKCEGCGGLAVIPDGSLCDSCWLRVNRSKLQAALDAIERRPAPAEPAGDLVEEIDAILVRVVNVGFNRMTISEIVAACLREPTMDELARFDAHRQDHGYPAALRNFLASRRGVAK